MTFIHQRLVRDESLVLSVDERLERIVSEWMPSLERTRETAHAPGASIRVSVRAASDDVSKPGYAAGKPALALGNAECWVDAANDRAFARTISGTIVAAVDLANVVCVVSVAEPGAEARDATSLLTIVSAILLVRLGRTPIHAGAVSPKGTSEVWLLVGDSHSGKSTTTANLARAGWSYLSDDYVVLSRGSGDSIDVEGWPDDFHIDEGWSRGESTGSRSTLLESELPRDSRAEAGTLAGMLFTRVSPGDPTAVTPLDPIVALERLIRQSPWLIVDSKSAPSVLALLRDAAGVGAGELRLGMDTYRDPSLLAQRIGQILSGSSG